jgi:hypothetical protein
MTDLVLAELERIFGAQSTEAKNGFVILPPFDEEEALDFLRTVPAGTSLKDLARLAAEHRGSYPVEGRGGQLQLSNEVLSLTARRGNWVE